MIALSVVLFLNAAFNVLVWPRFYKRVATDPRARDADGKATTFLKVHAVLIAIALVLALVSVIGGVAALAGALGGSASDGQPGGGQERVTGCCSSVIQSAWSSDSDRR